MVFTIPPRPPGRDNVTDFLNQVLPLITNEGYTAWIHGRTLYDYKATLDLDLALTGPVNNIEKLESLFYELYHVAWVDCRLILDLKWLSEAHTCELDENQEPKHRDVDFYMFAYHRLDSDQRSWETTKGPPFYSPISKDLVKANWSVVLPAPAKPHQIAEVKRHGRFQFIPASKFLTDIDSYM